MHRWIERIFTIQLSRILPVGVFPNDRLMGICRWIRSHFTDWFDRNGVTLSTKSQEWGCTLSGSGGSSKAGSCTQFRTDGLIISLDCTETQVANVDVHYLVVRKDSHGLSFVKLVAGVESTQSERNCFLEASIF